jgi:hypothetical protein
MLHSLLQCFPLVDDGKLNDEVSLLGWLGLYRQRQVPGEETLGYFSALTAKYSYFYLNGLKFDRPVLFLLRTAPEL